jgi:hypothetical protein
VLYAPFVPNYRCGAAPECASSSHEAVTGFPFQPGFIAEAGTKDGANGMRMDAKRQLPACRRNVGRPFLFP